MPQTHKKAERPTKAKTGPKKAVTERVTLDVHQWARLSEQAAELSLQAGRIIGVDEYLMIRVMDVVHSR